MRNTSEKATEFTEYLESHAAGALGVLGGCFSERDAKAVGIAKRGA